MGRDGDPEAVLDPHLRLRDGRGGRVAGLRVVDAGAMPVIVSGNTNAPVLMMAEKAARWILAERVTRPPAHRSWDGSARRGRGLCPRADASLSRLKFTENVSKVYLILGRVRASRPRCLPAKRSAGSRMDRRKFLLEPVPR